MTFVCHHKTSHHKIKRKKTASGKVTAVFVYWGQKTKPKQYLGLFVDVPGEGDGVVGDFFDVADGVKALLVIRCEDRQMEVLRVTAKTSKIQLLQLLPQCLDCYLRDRAKCRQPAKLAHKMTQTGSYCLLR